MFLILSQFQIDFCWSKQKCLWVEQIKNKPAESRLSQSVRLSVRNFKNFTFNIWKILMKNIQKSLINSNFKCFSTEDKINISFFRICVNWLTLRNFWDQNFLKKKTKRKFAYKINATRYNFSDANNLWLFITLFALWIIQKTITKNIVCFDFSAQQYANFGSRLDYLVLKIFKNGYTGYYETSWR